jgi:hypothetical protein
MAATTTTSLRIPAIAPAASVARVHAGRRHIDPRSGRALEVLGHAIEYLTDEFVEEGAPVTANDPRVQAVQLLMAVNRQVYFDCPIVPTFADRCRNFIHSCFA